MYASCGWRLACALPFLATILLALGAGQALAATPPGATVSSSNPNASFTGHVNEANFFPATCDTPQCPPGTSPTPCTDQEADPINLICEHFTVAAAEDGS